MLNEELLQVFYVLLAQELPKSNQVTSETPAKASSGAGLGHGVYEKMNNVKAHTDSAASPPAGGVHIFTLDKCDQNPWIHIIMLVSWITFVITSSFRLLILSMNSLLILFKDVSDHCCHICPSVRGLGDGLRHVKAGQRYRTPTAADIDCAAECVCGGEEDGVRDLWVDEKKREGKQG